MNFIILFINKTRVVALTPALQPIDGVAVSYIDAAVALGNTINEMDKYYNFLFHLLCSLSYLYIL